VKSKYDPLTSSPLSSPPSLRSRFHPRRQDRFASAERATRTFSFNSRGIIRRIPRLVASLDEEENKLYDPDILSLVRSVKREGRREATSRRDAVRSRGSSPYKARPSFKRFDLEACLALFTRLTRSTLRASIGSIGEVGDGERGKGVDLQGTRMSHTPAVRCVHKSVCRVGHGYVCILINTLLTPRPGNINHKTMENGAWGRSYSGDLSIPLSCTRRERHAAHTAWPTMVGVYARNLFNSSFSLIS